MKHTEHYQLSQFEGDDRIQMEDFNADNAKIDAALKAHDTAIGTKANSATVGALTTRVGNLETGKAEASALSAEVTARENADSALSQRIDSKAETNTVNTLAQTVGNMGLQLLKDITLSQNAPEWQISLSDINWNAWRVIHIDVTPIISGQGTITAYANYVSSSYSLLTFSGNTTASSTVGSFYLLGYPRYNAAHEAVFLGFTGCSSKFICDNLTRYADFSKLILKANNSLNIVAGSTVKIWGEK